MGFLFRVFYENAWPNTTPSEAYLIGFFNTQLNHYFFNNFCAFQQHALLSVVSLHIRTSGGRNKLPGITKNLKIDCLFRGIHIGNGDTQKNQILRCVFCAKNDEGKNCQQRKVLTSSPIRSAQFHEKSFFKSTRN